MVGLVESVCVAFDRFCLEKCAHLMKSSWSSWFGKVQPPNEEQYEKSIEQIRDKAPIPTMWLFGKTGSGKSSVIRYLTGAEAASIGQGYRPETRTSRRFDFPNSVEPLLSFLDTRGLGEASYNPQADIDRFNANTQLMIVTVRVTDHALQGIIEPLRKIRAATANRPVLLVLTCLHEALNGTDVSTTAPVTVDAALQSLVDRKVMQFTGLYDQLLTVDLTQPEDDFLDPNYGGPALRKAILDYLPQAYRQSLIALAPEIRPFDTQLQKKSYWQILASSSMAATAGAVPLPWVDIPAVLAIQTHLAYRIADIYDQPITPANWAVLSSVAGSRIAAQLAVRELLKFIPWVGMAAGAAGSFAFTYALGMSWDWYFADLRHGGVPSAEKLKEVFAEQLKRGQKLWGTGSG